MRQIFRNSVVGVVATTATRLGIDATVDTVENLQLSMEVTANTPFVTSAVASLQFSVDGTNWTTDGGDSPVSVNASGLAVASFLRIAPLVRLLITEVGGGGDLDYEIAVMG